jgi:hypothetical protein
MDTTTSPPPTHHPPEESMVGAVSSTVVFVWSKRPNDALIRLTIQKDSLKDIVGVFEGGCLACCFAAWLAILIELQLGYQ